jgi:hypothetical protein
LLRVVGEPTDDFSPKCSSFLAWNYALVQYCKEVSFFSVFMIVVRDPYLSVISSAHYHILSGKFIILTFSTLFSSSFVFCCSGVLLALDIYRSKFSATSPYIVNTIRNNDQFIWICTGLWAVSCLIFFFQFCFINCPTTFQFAEISNLDTHLALRFLRPEGTRKRAIPYGYGFNLVSCPNYFFEILGWAVIAVMTGSIAGTLY